MCFIPTKICSAVYDGMHTNILTIESSFVNGFAALQVIGNVSDVCKDGKERARAALEKLDIKLPPRRIIVNITPADLRADGSHLDLAFALSLSILIRKEIPAIDTQKWIFAAELGLNGELKPTKGIISFAIAAVDKGLEGIVISKDNLKELKILSQKNIPHLKNLKAIGFTTIGGVLDWIFNKGQYEAFSLDTYSPDNTYTTLGREVNFDDMILTDELQKLALTIACGYHNVLLRGNPGTGKSMFSERIPSILPLMEKETYIEALKIHSAYGYKISYALLQGRPPFRSPHHQSSTAAIIGSDDVPGELALAHGGVLFLDEIPEFRRDIIEALREPLETATIQLARAKKKIFWKCKVILITAANNCPCGWFGSKKKLCTCSTQKLISYQQKLSGPILDRIDIHFTMPEPSLNPAEVFVCLSNNKTQISVTKKLQEHVLEVKKFQESRNKALGIKFNRDIPPNNLLSISGLNEKEFISLINKYAANSASNRSVVKSLRVARTLADIEFEHKILEHHFALAWSWRFKSSPYKLDLKA